LTTISKTTTASKTSIVVPPLGSRCQREKGGRRPTRSGRRRRCRHLDDPLDDPSLDEEGVEVHTAVEDDGGVQPPEGAGGEVKAKGQDQPSL
jgi:hypothetical protein